jgi:hypothetical protein
MMRRASACIVPGAVACALLFPAAPAGAAEMDWLRIVPGDARFYVEIRDLARIRTLFRDLGIWNLVRELSGAPAKGASSQPWQRSAEELLGLSPDAAVTEVLGKRSALIASESSQWQNGVLLAELPSEGQLPPLLRRWRARSTLTEGPLRQYVLSGGLRLAVLDRTMVLGPAGDPDGLWGRTVVLLSGRKGPTLGGRSEFAALRARMKAAHQGLLYAAWSEGDAAAVAGCSRLLVGVDVSEMAVRCELHGQLARPGPRRPATRAPRGLPASTLAAWSASLDFGGLSRQAEARQSDDSGSLVDLLAGSLSLIDRGSGSLLGKLGPACTILVGRQSGGEQGIEVPTVSALIAAPEGQAHVAHMDAIMGFVAQVFASLAAEPGDEPRATRVQRKSCEGVDLHYVDVGRDLARRLEAPWLEGMEACWGLMGDQLVLSTAVSHAEEIIRARRGQLPRLGERSEDRDFENDADISDWFHLRGAPVSQMLATWLAYLRRERPEALAGEWWRQWAGRSLAEQTRLGVGLAGDARNPRYAVVREISADSPAADYLREGDVIVSVAGRPLATTQPAEEVAERYRQRGPARTFSLRVLREGELVDLAIPVPASNEVDLSEFDPVQAVARLITLTRRVDALTVWRYAGRPDRLDARILIRWEARPPS